MKKSKFIIVLLLFFYFSCNNSEHSTELTESNALEMTKDEVLKASLSNQIEYKRSHMTILAGWISEHKEELISHLSLQKRTYGDSHQVILEDFVNSINQNSKNDDLEIETINKSLSAFKNIGDESWMPIVFLANEASVSLQRNDNEVRTFLAVEDETVNGESMTAYEILSGENDDDLIPLNEPLTQDYIGDDNLIVMELMYAPEEEYSTGGGGSNIKTLKLNKMTIKELKEGWPFRSEISIKVYELNPAIITTNTDYECGEFVYASVNCHNYSGNRIVRLKRSWEDDERTYNWLIENSSIYADDIVFYVLFEEDGFPAPKRYERIDLPNNSGSVIEYRSWQSEYDYKKVSLDSNNPYNIPYAYTFISENSEVKYNLK